MIESVQKQYTHYPYPLPIGDLEQAVAGGYWEYGTYEFFWPQFHSLGKKRLNILVAGCGTNSAAYQAYLNKECNVTGIDISDTSLANQKTLKAKHDLKNLRIEKLDLLNASKLNEKFDLIISTGVIHHMRSPLEGLKALRECLTPSGFVHLMVYGKTLRQGVYLLQDAFKRAGLSFSSDEDIEIAKETVRSLGPDHIVTSYLKAAADDLSNAAGFVDTFLHTTDTAYFVEELLDLAEAAGLKFWDWEDKSHYAPGMNIPAGHPILRRIEALEERDQWSIIERLACTRGTHRIYLTTPQGLAENERINFKHDVGFYIPLLRPGLEVTMRANKSANQHAVLSRNGYKFFLDYKTARILELVNSQRTISEILRHDVLSEINVDSSYVISFLETMYNWGHIFFRR